MIPQLNNLTRIRTLELRIPEHLDLFEKMPKEDIAGRAFLHSAIDQLKLEYRERTGGIEYSRERSFLMTITTLRTAIDGTVCYTDEDKNQEHRYG